jgi:phospho-N-acetylmuramoyl-pentapeptide-transferase
VLILRVRIVPTQILIPFFGRVNFGAFYVVFMTIVIIGCANAANLTDGLDGLLTGVSFIIFIFLVVLSRILGYGELADLSTIVCGALAGFFLFNKNPAQIFMGDTGSLFLGAAIAGIAILMRLALILPLACVIFVVETLSVVIQVAYFKLTSRRVFKMSPLHHHFEMCGVSEKKIVRAFCLVTIISCILGFIVIKL